MNVPSTAVAGQFGREEAEAALRIDRALQFADLALRSRNPTYATITATQSR